MRLEPRGGERIDRSKAVSFTFAGWKVTGFEGDTIASAAFAAGQARVLALVQVPPAARASSAAPATARTAR